MSVNMRKASHVSPLLFGFIPIELYLVIVRNDKMNEKKAALSRINASLRSFLKCISSGVDCSFTPRNGVSLEITAHMSSFLTLLQKLLDIEDGQLADECYPLLMLLTEDLPTHILASIKDFLLAAIFHRLDKEAENIRKFIHTASLMLCKRLPMQFIFEFVLLQLRCHHSNIRRNSIDVLTTLILTNTISPLEIEVICGKLVQTLFDDEPKVIRAALECFAAIFSLNYMSENQFIKCLSTSMPRSLDEVTKGAILHCVEMRVKMPYPPKLGSDGLPVYEPGVSNFLHLGNLNAICSVGQDKCNHGTHSECKEIMKSPQRASLRRNAVQRTRQASFGYVDHFSALQKFGKATQSHLISRAAATNSTKRKICPSNLALEDLLRISDPARDAQSNGYAHIAERRRLKNNEILSRGRSLFPESSVLRSISEKKLNGLRRCYSALSLEERDGEGRTSFSQIADSIMSIKFSASKRLDSLRSRISQSRNCECSPNARRALKVMDSSEKTRSWTRETQRPFLKENLFRNSANNVTTVISKENREALTQMCSGYASEDVNQVAGTKPHVEVVLKRYQDENGGESFPQRSTSLMLVSALQKQIRPRLRKPLHARFKRSRTVHWASRALCGPGVDVRGAVDTLTSGEWEKQHDALQILSYFFGANLHTECHELRSWSLEQIQQLCSGLVFAASSLRSQVNTQLQMSFLPSSTVNMDIV